MNVTKLNKKESAIEALDAQITDLATRCRLDDWSSFIEELQVPGDIAPALITGRPEMLRAVQPRALTAEETAALIKVLGGLIETNNALREHARQLATFTEQWTTLFTGLHNVGEKIERFANFKRSYDDVDEPVE
jgi:hypothetical protein